MPRQRLQAGGLTRRVEVQAATETLNDFGEPVPTWSTSQTRWAKVEPLSGRELIQARAVAAATTHRISFRYFAGLTTKHRLKLGARIFHIEEVIDPDDEHEQLQVMCVEAA